MKEKRRKEDGFIKPQTNTQCVFLAYQASKELRGYDISNIIRKKSVSDLD